MIRRNAIISNVLVALIFLLGAGAAHAQDVMVVNGNVIAITDLDVNGTLYDVDFVFETGSTAYGDGFDFPEPNEATVVVARQAVDAALNDAVPVPDGAGPEGEINYFIGFDVDETADTIFSLGSERSAFTWDTCSMEVSGCLAPLGLIGAKPFLPDQVVSWALFSEPGTGTPTPEISIMPTSQLLSAGVLLGEDAADDEFFVSNSGSGTLDYTITVDQPWLSVSPTRGTSDGEMDPITVSYSTAGLDLDVYNATITVSDPNALNDSQVIDVTLVVTQLPAIALSESMLMPQAVLGNDPLPDSFTVINSGGLALFYDVSVDVNWMSVNPVDGLSTGEPDTIEVVYDTTGLSEGDVNGTITVADFLGGAVNSPQTIDVVLTITASAELGLTNVIQTQKVNTIPGIVFDPAGTYKKPAFSFDLPQTGISGNLLSHDGGSFTFSSNVTMESFTYGDWTFELRSTCAANGDACLVETNDGADTPWALRDVDLDARTARMVFTDTGAQAFNDLTSQPGPLQVFATSVQYKGNFPGGVGLDGADAACTLAATNADLSGTWTAWLSDDTTDARDRISDGEYRLLDGTLVANSLADLTDVMLVNPINIDELGAPVSANSDETWTATDSDGTYSGGGTCLNWTSIDVGDVAQIGLATEMDATWTDVDFEDTCDSFNRLYCFSSSQFQVEETFAVVEFIPEPSAAALASAALTALGLIRLTSRRRRG